MNLLTITVNQETFNVNLDQLVWYQEIPAPINDLVLVFSNADRYRITDDKEVKRILKAIGGKK